MSEHLYLHIPFCRQKCAYCDFYSLEAVENLSRFVSALKREIELRVSREDNFQVETIYFGGGTPSLLSPGDLESILDTIFKCCSVSPGAEITLEANPGTIGPGYFKGLKRLGINRLSLGIQSFNDEKLNTLGRIHNTREARAVIEQARKSGFDNIGLDLIYGVGGESVRAWQQDMATALGFRPEHLSCYMLTLEPGTPLYRRFRCGKFRPMPPSDQVDLFSTVSSDLERAGFLHYEISNFARAHRWISRHNSSYWQMKPYAGFGPSAHSLSFGRDPDGKTRPVRSWNVSDLNRYIQDIGRGCLPLAERETLAPAQQMAELVMIGLRTRQGIDLGLFDSLSRVPFEDRFHSLLDDLGGQGLGRLTDDRRHFALTRRGWARLDGIVESFARDIL